MPGIKRLHEISVQDHRLKYLSMAARHGSMRAAADALGIAPSSISRQIGQLEQDLKIDLVEKGSYKMQLTEAGQLLIEYHDSRLVEHNNLLARLADLRNVRTSTLHIAVGEGLLTPEMTMHLEHILARHPDITLDLVTATSSEIQRLVLNGAAELGLVFDTQEDVRLGVKVAINQPVRLIARADAAILQHQVLDLEIIAQEKLILPGPETRLAEIIQSVFRDAGIRPNAAVVSNTLGPIVEAVHAGIGVALIPEIMVMRQLRSGEFASRPIALEDFDQPRVHLVSRIGHRLSPAALSLMSAMAGTLNAMALARPQNIAAG